MRSITCACGLLLITMMCQAADDYRVQAGDLLQAGVWKEPDLQVETLVRPDGRFSFPLVGEVDAGGRTISEIQASIIAGIETFVPDPVVTVTLVQSLGNKVYVLGKVNRPGEFPMVQDLDVMQALALGGGLATFADADRISILRREGTTQKAIEFDYTDVEYGRKLDQNIILQPGDIVVVP